MKFTEYVDINESKSEGALPARLKVRLISRFNEDRNVTIKELEGIAEREGTPFNSIVEAVCDILQEILYRRKSTRTAKVDPKQLKMGIEHELEHAKDKQIAEIIARDHLVTVPNYYTLLKEIDDD